jgi:UDP-N-acetylglucosamine 2-epimerase
MGIILEPIKGQPIDYGYISEIVKQVNSLTNSYQSSKTNVVIDGIQVSQQPSIFTKQYSLPTDSSSTTKVATLIGTVTVNFPSAFSKPPTINASYQPAATTTKKSVNLVIESVTTSGATIKVFAQEAGAFGSGIVHVIAIGLPV